jgi:hypothetical protein
MTNPNSTGKNWALTCDKPSGGMIEYRIRADGTWKPLPASLSLPDGTTVHLRATGYAGYAFSAWKEDLGDTVSEKSLHMDDDYNVGATFRNITGLYHVMYPLVFFYSKNPQELNEKRELMQDSGNGTWRTIVDFIGDPLKSAVFSKNGKSLKVIITSSGTIIVESEKNNKSSRIPRIINSFLLAFAILTDHTCLFCKGGDLNKIRIEPVLSPEINNHWSIGRIIASSKDHFEDEVKLFMSDPFHEDIIDHITKVAKKIYKSKHINSYMREFEAMYHFATDNFDTSFILHWVQIERFLKKNMSPGSGYDKITEILRSFQGLKVVNKVEQKDRDSNGKLRRVKSHDGVPISLSMANRMRRCYERRNEIVHEGKSCTKKDAELCKSIAQKFQFWRLIKVDNIDFELYRGKVDGIRDRENKKRLAEIEMRHRDSGRN